MIDVGFTGTRNGMSPAQLDHVLKLVSDLAAVDHVRAHHGDCVGADVEFHTVCARYAQHVVIHPPVDEMHRAHCERDSIFNAACKITVLPAKTHLARNRDIVTQSDMMIATPYEFIHQTRGGTWYTADYTRKLKKPLALVLRSGKIAHVEFSGASWVGRTSN